MFRAILVCVDYLDLLKITLPWNRHHFNEIMVVTTHADADTITYAAGAVSHMHVTDAFTRDGAIFNKFRAIEEALDVFGRHGIICLLDADILWPKVLPEFPILKDTLYCPKRRMLRDPHQFTESLNWETVPKHTEYEFCGYSQIFHADDKHLGKPPWHQIQWTHAGGADSFFQARWPAERKIRPPFEVLHLGEEKKNWCGRSTPYLDGTKHPQSTQRVEQLMFMLNNRNQFPNPFHREHIRIPRSK